VERLAAEDRAVLAVASVAGAVGSVTAPVTAGTVSDKTGYALSAAGVQAIWDALTSALTTVGSVGKRIVDYLDAAVSSRNATTPPTVAAIRAEIDANSTQLAAIVADTNELQAELADGGRTDLLVDAIKAKTDELTFTTPNSVDATADVTLSQAQIDDIADQLGATLASEVWANGTRTLTQTAAEVAAVLAGSDITIHRGDSFSLSLTGLGNISTRTKLWFTVKSGDVADTLATIQIEETGGLLYLNGAAGTALQGDITVDDAVAGDITITLDEAATSLLAIANGLTYDVQVLTAAGGVQTLTEGAATVSRDITRAVS